MSKKLDIITLMTVLSVTVLFWVQSCDDSDVKTSVPKNELPAKKAVDEILASRKSETFDMVRDYMLNINGYHSYVAQLDSLRPISQDVADINDIKSQYTLGGTVTRRVTTDGVKILDKLYSEIDTLLARYNISLADRVISYDHEFAILVNQDASDADVIYIDKEKMAFVGAGRDLYSDCGSDFWVFRDTEGAFNTLLSAIYSVVDDAQLDMNTNRAIKSEAKKKVLQTKHNLETNRHAIEHEYRDYYMLDEYGKKTLGVGAKDFGYEFLDDESMNGKYAVTYRYTSLYNPNLNPEFFADTSATYKLTKAGSRDWRVEKHFADGKIEKTPAFSGKATVSKQTSVVPNIDARDNTNFEFEQDTVSGGRVFFDEIVKIQPRKKDWKAQIPPRAQNTIDSLNQEITHKEELRNLAARKKIEADSIANNVIIKRFAENQR